MSPDDWHMLAATVNTFLQSINPILCAAFGAWVHKWGQSSGPPK